MGLNSDPPVSKCYPEVFITTFSTLKMSQNASLLGKGLKSQGP